MALSALKHMCIIRIDAERLRNMERRIVINLVQGFSENGRRVLRRSGST